VRVRALLAWIVLALFLSGGLAWYWVLHTEPGARWVLARVQSATDGALEIDTVGGNLARGLSTRGVSFARDGLRVSASEVVLSVDVDLLPVSVDVVAANLRDVEFELSPSDVVAERRTDIEQVLQRLRLPVPVRIKDLVVSDVAVRTPAFARDFDEVGLQGSWHDTIIIDRLFVGGAGLSVTLDGVFDPATDLAHVSSVSAKFGPELTGYHEGIDIELRSEGSQRQLDLEVDVMNLDARLQGELRHVFHAPEWDLEITVPRYAWPLGDAGDTLELQDVIARSRGTPDDYSVRFESTLSFLALQQTAVRFEGRGNREGFSAGTVDATGEAVQLAGSAEVRWAGERFVGADIAIARFDPRPWLAGWPEGFPVAGTVSARLDDALLRLSDTDIGVPRTGARVRIDADLDRESDVVSGTLAWRDIRWPLAGDAYRVTSDSGDVTVRGTLDDWRVDGRIAVGTGDMPGGRFDVAGRGDRDGAAARIIDGSILSGTVAGRVEYSWRGAQPWRGEVDVASLATEAVLPDWPGHVSGSIRAEGNAGQRAWDITLDGVTGEIRGSPLRASGRVTRVADTFATDALHVEHGNSFVTLDGSPGAAEGLAFAARIDGIGRYLADMSGSLAANGAMRLTRGDPFLSLNLESEALAFRDVLVTGLRVVDERGAGDIANASVVASELAVADRTFNDVSLRVAVTDLRQSLELSAAYLDGAVSILLDGAFDDWRAPLESTWRGQVRTLSLAIDNAHSVSLLAPAAATLSTKQAGIEALCVGRDIARLCVDSSWQADGRYATTLTLEQVPIGLVEVLADTGLRFDQVLDGRVSWRHEPATGPSGGGRLTMSPGRIRSTDDPSLGLRTGMGSLYFEIVNNTLLSGAISLPMPGSGEIRGDFTLEDIGQPADSGVSGEFDASVAEIAILSEMIPFLDAASGRLQAQARLSGTLSAPLVTGALTVENGRFEYRPLGLVLEDLRLDGTMGRDYQVDISSSFRCGEGRGELQATADYRDISRPSIDAGLQGEKLLLVNVPDVRMAVDPDLRIVATPETLAINGTLRIPEARIKPVNLTTTRVYESEDVVVVAGELPDPPVERNGDGIRYSGRLDVRLGKNVVVDLDLARARVTGSTKFAWRDDPMPVATGRYDIGGTISALGQVLEITEGSVRFPDVPADSPYLRIRAEREIYGNTQIKRAGVLVDGPLKRPTMEAYTQPLTTEERALTLLVTGSDFDYEQGVGAIDFGTYVAPRLFISYGVGVFERENIISARFDLSRGFGIKASSGSNESGVDLNYRFEN